MQTNKALHKGAKLYNAGVMWGVEKSTQRGLRAKGNFILASINCRPQSKQITSQVTRLAVVYGLTGNKHLQQTIQLTLDFRLNPAIQGACLTKEVNDKLFTPSVQTGFIFILLYYRNRGWIMH